LAATSVSNVIPLRAGSSNAPTGTAGAASTARNLYPAYDVEGLPDAHHDESGAVYNTGKVRALRPHGIPTPSGAHRPPVLASEVLREDLAPHEPGAAMVRRIALGCGIATAVVAVGTLGGSMAGIAVLLFGAAQVCAALLPVSYATRATLLVACTTALLAGSTVAKVTVGADEHPGLVLPILVLATGLLFRSWHRASRHARWVVATGIALSAAWLGWSDGVEAAFSVPHWQSWLLAVARLTLAPVLLLSLLAFMGETTTGGCAAWAGCALGWYGAITLIEIVAAAWPVGASMPTLESLQQGATAARLLGALAAPGLAVGIAQLMVVAASEPTDAGDVARPA
jgi:hypothetical protein